MKSTEVMKRLAAIEARLDALEQRNASGAREAREAVEDPAAKTPPDTVHCPILGELAADRCLTTQLEPFSAANPLRVALYRACRGGCPNSRLGEKA